MFWADVQEGKIAKRFPDTARSVLIRDEKTPSGRVHIGSLRGVAVHGLVADVLRERNYPVTYKYEFNDFDPMDGIPAELDPEVWSEHLGKPLRDVPSPDGVATSFAEYYANEFAGVIRDAGFTPEYYRSSELYLSGKMNDVIREALEGAEQIRAIYREVSGSQKGGEWLPISVVCEHCGKVGTTQGYAWDGERVSYRCTKGPGGAVGCGHEGTVTPWDGAAKLPWKVEWAAKWKVVGVDIEGAGKDHSTKGGSREVAERISREVFHHEPPFDIPYEFFLDKDGKKMSSSKGRGVSSREIADNFPPVILRLALLGKDPAVQTSIDPDGELLALLYDWYDKIAEKYWDGVGDDDARLFILLHHSTPPQKIYLPRFSSVAFIAQMQHLDPVKEVAAQKGGALTEQEIAELNERIAYAKVWLTHYAPEKYRFTLATSLPEAVHGLSKEQRAGLAAIADFVATQTVLDGAAFHEELHAIKERLGIAPKDLFSAIYLAFLGRNSGPQAGWFLSTLDREFLLKRLHEAANLR